MKLSTSIVACVVGALSVAAVPVPARAEHRHGAAPAAPAQKRASQPPKSSQPSKSSQPTKRTQTPAVVVRRVPVRQPPVVVVEQTVVVEQVVDQQAATDATASDPAATAPAAVDLVLPSSDSADASCDPSDPANACDADPSADPSDAPAAQ